MGNAYVFSVSKNETVSGAMMSRDNIATPEYIRQRVRDVADYHAKADTPLHYKVRGSMLGNLQKACEMYIQNNFDLDDKKEIKEQGRAIRLLVLSYLCLPDNEMFEVMDSSKHLTDGQWLGLTYWQFGHGGNSDKIAKRRENFLSELDWIIYRAQYDLARSRAKGGLTMSQLYVTWQVPDDMKEFVDEIKINAPFVIEKNLETVIDPDPIDVPTQTKQQSSIRDEIIDW